MQDFWLRQDKDKPLFEDILWSRPENKQAAGKLLIVGGNAHGFARVAEAYSKAVQSGTGSARVVLPESLRKSVGKMLENCEYATSNPSGGFAKEALGELLAQAGWADAVLLAGDFGRNAETAITLEHFVQKYSGLLSLTTDALDYFIKNPDLIIDRPKTLIVASLAQLQKLALASKFTEPMGVGVDLMQLVDSIHNFSEKHKAHFITHYLGTTLVSAEGKLSSTKTGSSDDIWRIPTAAKATVFWLQNPQKPFEATTVSLAD